MRITIFVIAGLCLWAVLFSNESNALKNAQPEAITQTPVEAAPPLAFDNIGRNEVQATLTVDDAIASVSESAPTLGSVEGFISNKNGILQIGKGLSILQKGTKFESAVIALDDQGHFLLDNLPSGELILRFFPNWNSGKKDGKGLPLDKRGWLEQTFHLKGGESLVKDFIFDIGNCSITGITGMEEDLGNRSPNVNIELRLAYHNEILHQQRVSFRHDHHKYRGLKHKLSGDILNTNSGVFLFDNLPAADYILRFHVLRKDWYIDKSISLAIGEQLDLGTLIFPFNDYFINWENENGAIAIDDKQKLHAQISKANLSHQPKKITLPLSQFEAITE